MCQGSCVSTSCQKTCSPREAKLAQALADIQMLVQQQLHEVAGREAPLTPAQATLRVIAARAAAGLEEPDGAGAAVPIAIHRIKRRADSGSVSGAAITERMVAICGCQGGYDCDCVSVENQARHELTSEYNARQRAAA